MKKHLSTIVSILVFAIGLSLLLYPAVSDLWNSAHQSRTISSYLDAVSNVSSSEYQSILDSASAYNQTLRTKSNRWFLSETERQEYNRLLNLSGNGVMGYLEIPSIHVSLPVYHSLDEAVLQVAVGHVEGTSLPTGGAGTHCVLSGHRGLPSAQLFTNLDQLTEGDLFTLQVLNETLVYEVDQIHIVEPKDLSHLNIVEGEDLCTLVTCTPYGVNSHRLLVRGHRIDSADAGSVIRVTAEAVQIDPLLVAPAVGAVLLILLAAGSCFHRHSTAKRRIKDSLLNDDKGDDWNL